jgi:hypothetical protein
LIGRRRRGNDRVFVAVFVFDTEFHATAGPTFVVVTPVVLLVRAVPSSIVPIVPVSVSSAIFVAITIIITVAAPSPVGTPFAVFPAHTVAVAATHPPVATHRTRHETPRGPFGSRRVVMR